MFNYLIGAFFTYIIKLAAKIVFFCIQSIAYEFFFQQLGEVINSRRILRIGRRWRLANFTNWAKMAVGEFYELGEDDGRRIGRIRRI